MEPRKFLDFEFYNSNNFKHNVDISILILFVLETFENLSSLSYFKKRNNPIKANYSKSNSISSHEFSSYEKKKKNIDTLPFENLRSLNYPKNPENRKSNNISLRICIQKKNNSTPLSNPTSSKKTGKSPESQLSISSAR